MSAVSQPIPAPAKQQPTLAPKPVLSRPSGGRPWKWLILLALVGVVAFLAYRAVNQPSTVTPVMAVKTAKATMGNLERTIRVSGQTSAVRYANVTAPAMRGPDSNREMILLMTATAGSWVK